MTIPARASLVGSNRAPGEHAAAVEELRALFPEARRHPFAGSWDS